MSLNYCDVCALPDGRLAFVHDYDTGVICEIDGREQWRVPTPSAPLHLRCGLFDDSFVAAWKDHDSGLVFAASHGNHFGDYGPSFGDNSVAVGPEGLYIARSGSNLDIVGLNGVIIRRVPAALGSQGIRDVLPTGEIRLGDAWLSRTVGGLWLSQPCQRGSVWVGQYPTDSHSLDPAQIAGVDPNDVPFTAFLGLGFEPHLAALSDGRYAVCARTPSGPRLVFLPPFQPLVTGTPPPHPPIPAPVPPEPPVLTKNYEGFLRARWDAEHMNGSTEVAQAQWLFRAVRALADNGEPIGLEFNANGFALASRPDDASTRRSSDFILIRDQGALWGVDVIGGYPSRIWWGVYAETIDPASWREPFSWAELGDMPMPTTPPDASLEMRVAVLEAQSKAFQAWLTELAGPRKVAIKSSRAHYLRDDWDTDAGKFDRTEAGSGETYTLEPK